MKPKTHIISSALLGLTIYYFSRSIGAGLLSFFGGVFVDLDHLVDFYISRPQNPLSIRDFLHPEKYMQSNNKAYVPFHAYEFAIILWFLSWQMSWNPLLVGLSSGYSLHLVLDDIGNHLKTFSYFLSYRAWKKFRVFREKSI